MAKALLVIDMQNDFMEGGALAIPHANSIIITINNLIKQFATVIAAKDWHPAHHKSFAVHHPGRKEGDIILIDGKEQRLWPIHCVKHSHGAQWALDLEVRRFDHVVYKGSDPIIDSYSAFFDNSHQRSTGLHEELQRRKIDELFLCGVATDYCVKFSVLDACALGYKVWVIKDACCGVNTQTHDSEQALAVMRKASARIIESQDTFLMALK